MRGEEGGGVGGFYCRWKFAGFVFSSATKSVEIMEYIRLRIR